MVAMRAGLNGRVLSRIPVSPATVKKPAFGGANGFVSPLVPVDTYAHQVPTDDPVAQRMSGRIAFYKSNVPPPGSKNPRLFLHRPDTKAAIHTLPVVTDSQGKQYLHLLLQNSPVMGGKTIVQLPAGVWGDQGDSETAIESSIREVKEEAGYDVKSARMLTNQFFATSPGMTTEIKGFALADVTGQPSGDHRSDQEKASIIGTLDVPLSIFRDYNAFMTWMGEMHARNYLVGMDILAARALLPPDASAAAAIV